MLDMNMLEDLIESLKLEDDWECANVSKVGNFYTMRKNGLRIVVYINAHQNRYRMNIIGPNGRTLIYESDSAKNLYERLSGRLGTNEPEEDLQKHRDEMYQRALERLK